jgi:hypothetical protein
MPKDDKLAQEGSSGTEGKKDVSLPIPPPAHRLGREGRGEWITTSGGSALTPTPTPTSTVHKSTEIKR